MSDIENLQKLVKEQETKLQNGKLLAQMQDHIIDQLAEKLSKEQSQKKRLIAGVEKFVLTVNEIIQEINEETETT